MRIENTGLPGSLTDAAAASAPARAGFESPDILSVQWVFGYGSLIWNPEFDHAERQLATVRGYHRAFCISSTVYRGTPERPGVVLGLARGGSVHGMSFRLREDTRHEALARLYEREMLNRVYLPRVVTARLSDGRRVRVLAFVADPRSPLYLDLCEDEITGRLCDCAGARGPNHEYAINTFLALQALGVHDARLARLVRRIESRAQESPARPHRRLAP